MRAAADADRASPGGLDQRKVIDYSAGWLVLEEDIDNHLNNSSLNGVDKRTQQIWGVRSKRVDITAIGW